MSLIIHPEYTNLKNRLSSLIFKYEELKNQICPNMEREYIIKFGLLEYQLYQKDLELNKLKRKAMLIQIQINNEKDIDLKSIEKQLKIEFEQYEKNLKKQMEELDDAIINQRRKLPENDAKQLKKIYRQCIFKLHPDLNPDLTQNEKALFNMITNAFKNGDLKLLKTLSQSLKESDNNLQDINDITSLISEIEKRISDLKEKFPYNKKELLSNPKKTVEYRNNLKKLLKDYNYQIEIYTEKIAKLI